VTIAAFYVVRTKSSVIFKRRSSRAVDKTTGVRSGHTVILTAVDSAKVYPDALRRVSYFDVETGKRFRDQAAPANQGFLWHQRERGEDPHLDRCPGLRPGRHRPEAARSGGKPLPNSTDSQRYPLRENAHSTGPPATRLPRRVSQSRQSTDSVRFIARQL